jgi:dihydrodipicolinate reductase
MASLRAKTVFADQGITVTAVESLELRSDRTNRRQFITGRLEPIAVIVREPDRTYAFDMGAQSIDIDELNLPADFELE